MDILRERRKAHESTNDLFIIVYTQFGYVGKWCEFRCFAAPNPHRLGPA